MPTPTILDDVFPIDLGLPAKFPAFRKVQQEATDFALYGPDGAEPRRFMAMSLPTGSGKSLSAHAIGALSGVRYAVLTATRALEDQQVDDKFALTNIRGRANYSCVEFDIEQREAQEDYDRAVENAERIGEDPTTIIVPDVLKQASGWTCDDGYDHDCRVMDRTMCPYKSQAEEAKGARAVLTNYQYWMNVRAQNPQALETVDDPIRLLIADESHMAMREISRFLGTWVSTHDLHKHANDVSRAAVRASKGAEWGKVGQAWIEALSAAFGSVVMKMDAIESKFAEADERGRVRSGKAAATRLSKEYRALDKLSRNLSRILAHAEDGNWIWKQTKAGVAFECIWPRKYAERYLWSGVDRIVVMSATLRPKALYLTGIGSTESCFKEWPRVFPANLSPVYWIPTAKMSNKSTDAELDKVVARMDEIIESRLDRKGIIHTASYRRAEVFQAKSKFGRLMILNQSGEQQKSADKFRNSNAPRLLVSPSYTTGYDFADSACEYQIIVKLPFADRTDPVMVARMDDDKDYYAYETMQTLVQACGRGSRHEQDRCETFIIDDSVGNFRFYAKAHAPRWFSIRKADRVPVAPPKL